VQYRIENALQRWTNGSSTRVGERLTTAHESRSAQMQPEPRVKPQNRRSTEGSLFADANVTRQNARNALHVSPLTDRYHRRAMQCDSTSP
jgi:hypothetical protein